MQNNSLIARLAQHLDTIWMKFNGVAIDTEHALSDDEPRTPFTFYGTLKVAPSSIPGADDKLHKALERYGGWEEVMESPRPVPEELFMALERLGYTRDCIEKSREYIHDPVAYNAKVIRGTNAREK